MLSPWSRVKRRIGAAIQVRADRAIESRLQGVLATIHAITQQMITLTESVSAWESRSDSAINGLGQSIRRLRDEQTQLGGALSAQLSESLTTLEHHLKTLESRIRARPFIGDPSNWMTDFDGRKVMGFKSSSTLDAQTSLVDAWRPSELDLQHHLRLFLQWLPTVGTAVDLGSGRGEFVAIMNEHGLNARGVDRDQKSADAANHAGNATVVADVGDFLIDCPTESVDVFSAIHIVEHVDSIVLRDWLLNLRRSLKPGGVLLIETPNPHAIDAFKAFWLDVTHVRPYYPEALVLELARAGFSEAFVVAPEEIDGSDDPLGLAGSYVILARR